MSVSHKNKSMKKSSKRSRNGNSNKKTRKNIRKMHKGAGNSFATKLNITNPGSIEVFTESSKEYPLVWERIPKDKNLATFKISIGDKFKNIDGKSIFVIIGCSILNNEERLNPTFLCNNNINDIICNKYSVMPENKIGFEKKIKTDPIYLLYKMSSFISIKKEKEVKEVKEEKEDKVYAKKGMFSWFKKEKKEKQVKENQVNSRSKDFFGKINRSDFIDPTNIDAYIASHGGINNGKIKIGKLDINDQLKNEENTLLFVVVSNLDEYTVICDKYFIVNDKIEINSIKITYNELNAMDLTYIF